DVPKDLSFAYGHAEFDRGDQSGKVVNFPGVRDIVDDGVDDDDGKKSHSCNCGPREVDAGNAGSGVEINNSDFDFILDLIFGSGATGYKILPNGSGAIQMAQGFNNSVKDNQFCSPRAVAVT